MTDADDPPRPPLDRYRGFAVRFPVQVPEHRPMQPSWICASCAEPWPCKPARTQLLAETASRTELAITMWAYLDDYVRDHARAVEDAFSRFLGWTATDA